MKATEDLTIEVKGSFQCKKDNNVDFLKNLQMIGKTNEQIELVGIALGKYYGCPTFKLEEKIYLLRDCSFEKNHAVLTLFLPEDLRYWQSVNEFLDGELEK